MSPRWWALALAVPMVAIYGYRAVVGVPAGIAMARGNLSVSRGAYRLALPELRRGALGFNRFESAWKVGDSAIDVWENRARNGGPTGADPALLEQAATAYAEGICLAPASRRPWAGLALVYHKLEWLERLERSASGQPHPAGWLGVGRGGRVAVGLARRAIERSPTWHVYRDWLARAFWTFGLDSEMKESVRDSARVMPLYYAHTYLNRVLDAPVMEEFIATSRAYVGRVPLVDPATQLIDLGKLELRVGNSAQAVEDFSAAMDYRLDSLREAEANFNLGLALADTGRLAEARERLSLSSEHPVFEIPALLNLVYFAERSGDDEAALKYLLVLRRADADNVDYCLRYAAAATRLSRWAAALEALRWARLVEPKDLRSLVMMIEVNVASADSAAAHASLRELETVDPENAEITRLRGLMRVAS